MAQIRLSISRFSIHPLTTANWSRVPGSTFSGMRSGSIGRSAMFHFTQRSSVSPGSHSETRWPMAQVTTYSSPTRQPSPRPFTPSTRAMSRATEGFSATISFLDMRFSIVLEGADDGQQPGADDPLALSLDDGISLPSETTDVMEAAQANDGEGGEEFVIVDGVLIEYNGTGGAVTIPVRS